jgi:hypothetical protein
MHPRVGGVAGIVLATAAAAAAPLQARTPVYGGIGATIANFQAAHRNAAGRPPAGVTYYRMGDTLDGRVVSYHVVVGWKSRRNPSEVLVRLTGSRLPPDAKVVQPYNGSCAVYGSRWLGRVVGAPYVVVYAPAEWENGAMASRAPKCRG